jgi:hypothetical protein
MSPQVDLQQKINQMWPLRAYNPSFQDVGQEDPTFKVIITYMVSLRSFQANETLSQKQKINP